MEKTLGIAILAVFLTVGLVGCETMGAKEGAGTMIGAGTGALIGSQIGSGEGTLVAVAIGTLAGALMGQSVGRSLDRADEMAMERSAQYSLEHNRSGNSTTWENPDTGNSGSVTPVRTYETAQGAPCREYLQTIRVGGEDRQAYGTACRQADGSWKITK